MEANTQYLIITCPEYFRLQPFSVFCLVLIYSSYYSALSDRILGFHVNIALITTFLVIRIRVSLLQHQKAANSQHGKQTGIDQLRRHISYHIISDTIMNLWILTTFYPQSCRQKYIKFGSDFHKILCHAIMQ